jgi:hypothetical protein
MGDEKEPNGNLFNRIARRAAVLKQATEEFRAAWPDRDPEKFKEYVLGVWKRHESTKPAFEAFHRLSSALDHCLVVAQNECASAPRFSLGRALVDLEPRMKRLREAMDRALDENAPDGEWGERSLATAIMFRQLEKISSLRDAVFWAVGTGAMTNGKTPTARLLAVAFIVATEAKQTTSHSGETPKAVINREAKALRKSSVARRRANIWLVPEA